MIGKLRFKTAMFEGVLDGGDDRVFVGDKSRFEQMMESLSEAFDEEVTQPTTEIEIIDSEDQEAIVEEDICTSTATMQTQGAPMAEDASTDSSPNNDKRHGATVPKSANAPQELITQGVSFLSGLAQTLQSPEATEQLVNALVETNEQTGESTLRIPGPDKQTVTSLLNLVGKLFGGQ